MKISRLISKLRREVSAPRAFLMLLAFLALAIAATLAQTPQPSKEYVRLGGRVIAIEAPTSSVTATATATPTPTGGTATPTATPTPTPTGGGGSTPTPSPTGTPRPTPAITVSISPTGAPLGSSQTQQFTATVTDTTGQEQPNQAVTWSISPAVGSITSFGFYTAPATISTRQSVTVTATSQEDQTKSASALVTLLPPSQQLQAGSVSPSAGTGVSEVFYFGYFDSGGAANVSTALMLINAALSPMSACYVRYDQVHNQLSLANDSNTAWLGPGTPGVAGTVANSQCTLDFGASSITPSGDDLWVGVALTFQPAVTGMVNFYTDAQDNTAGLATGWLQTSYWTVPQQTPVAVRPWRVWSVGPGQQQQFAATVTGTSNTAVTWSISPTGVGSISSSGLYQAPSTIGAQQTVTVTAASQADTTKSAAVTVTLTPSPQTLQAVSVTPSSGSGASQTFSFLFWDANGYADVSSMQVAVGPQQVQAGVCYLYATQSTPPLLWLMSDDGTTWSSPITLGSSGTLQNSQCTVNAAGSSFSGTGNNVTLNLALSFTASFGGAQNVYTSAQDATWLSTGWQQLGTWTVPGSAPAAPTGLTATAGNAQVSLSWTASSGATSYNVYRGASSGGEGSTAIATGITATAYTDSSVTNGTAYYYKVAAVNAGGTSPQSNEASATPQVPAPAAPTGLTATAGNAQVSLSWTASSGATSYNVYRGTSSGGEGATAIATGITATAYTDSSVTNGTAYYYKVAAVNAGGTSPQSNEASATPQVSAPAAPTGLTATAGNAQVSLSWTASSGATSYNVYRGTSSGGEGATAIATGITATAYTDSSVTNGTAYYYKVAAVNAGGTSPQSNEASATPQVSAPAAPTGLTATAGNAQVSLSWTASSGATSYNVYRGASSGGEGATAIATGITATAYTDSSVTNGTAYYYKVAAVNAGGTSPQSNEASATPTVGSSYGYTRAITIAHTKVPNTDQANFTVLLQGTYAYLATAANGGRINNTAVVNGVTVPADLVFTADSAGQSLLNWEVESYNPATGAVSIWVEVPNVSHTTDTTLYMFYGNAAVSTFQGGVRGAAWDSNYIGVYHLGGNGSGLSTSDSTANGNNGTDYGATPVSGIIDGAGGFASASSQYISTTALAAAQTTISGWINRADTSPDPIVGAGSGSLSLFVRSSTYGSVVVLFEAGTTTLICQTSGGVASGAWHYVVGTYDSSSGACAVYVDGALGGSGTNKVSLSNNALNIGSSVGVSSSTNYFNGSLDEVRISKAVRSADWVTATFNNQSSPGTFYSVWPEVPTGSVAVAVTPATAALYPSQTQQFTAMVNNAGTTAVTWSINPNVGTISASGLYTAPASISTQQQVTVTATSQADTTKSATATVTLNPPPVAVSVSPTSATLQMGQTRQFTATVTGTSNTAVTWSISPSVGSISSSGLYTPPSPIPSQQTVTVKATSQADNTKSASASITLVPVSVFLNYSGSTTLGPGQTLQFTAIVGGTTNTAVTWSLSLYAPGTISSSGLYTAPSSISSTQYIQVTATSQADPTKWAGVPVTLQPIAVSVSPASVEVYHGQTQQFTATVVGTTNTAVTWSLSSGAYGTISTSGLYTAPAYVPTTQTITVTATSKADATKMGYAQLWIYE